MLRQFQRTPGKPCIGKNVAGSSFLLCVMQPVYAWTPGEGHWNSQQVEKQEKGEARCLLCRAGGPGVRRMKAEAQRQSTSRGRLAVKDQRQYSAGMKDFRKDWKML